VVIYESATGVAPDKLPLQGVKPSVVFSVPITDLAKQHAGTDKAKNIVFAGLLAGWFGIGRESVVAGLRKKFAKEGVEVVEGNPVRFRRASILPTPIRSRKTANSPRHKTKTAPSCSRMATTCAVRRRCSPVARFLADIDWPTRTISYLRKKTGTLARFTISKALEKVLHQFQHGAHFVWNPNPSHFNFLVGDNGHRLKVKAVFTFIHRQFHIFCDLPLLWCGIPIGNLPNHKRLNTKLRFRLHAFLFARQLQSGWRTPDQPAQQIPLVLSGGCFARLNCQ
jgi:Pyruvate ferredoxin/flavodoxin oxidoreductase